MKSADRLSTVLCGGVFLALGLGANLWFLHRQFGDDSDTNAVFLQIALYGSQVLFVAAFVAIVFVGNKGREGASKQLTHAFGWTAILSGLSVTLAFATVMLAGPFFLNNADEPVPNPASWMDVTELGESDPRGGFQIKLSRRLHLKSLSCA